ncbi:MAG: hypothetical protein OXC19_01975 [Bryobacterales bacterium]|nr:hypothetical protein [Bryobacterales bacterium]
MPFLKSLVGQAVRRVAQDPRVREKARDIIEKEIKPRAKNAWEQAQPEIEAAWEKAKPEVEAAKKRAAKGAANIAQRVKREIKESRAAPKTDSEA